ncbi:hypothetical protein Lesp02_60750 [Lentzea sp. NBRC 105346]|uniref:hypothetical protein n=1 Tax=Lentzea sp. NBRC 105346 TaxID=3032205 RepID=UPI0025550A72|nr:hypothetical protein [Lentzea sp. NBRC 105346]GLZ33887.1 hypothetical protein Lesp02_60750 [Lentzea sp. NBRC 105346]
MRLIRLGAEPSAVGADVRAALTTWGVGNEIVGGVALLGVQPPDCPRALDAVVVLPRGVLVIVGVDLPDPAVRLEAPLAGQWKIDGWPLVSPDGTPNPATEAVEAATAVAHRIQAMRAEPLPVSTVVAVGPFVKQVVQPTVDLNRGVRVLHPKPTSLISAARELATSSLPCGVEHAARLLAVLSPTGTPPKVPELLAEGFSDAVTPDLASASTMLIPKITDARPKARKRLPTTFSQWSVWAAGAALVVILVVFVLVMSLRDGDDTASATASSAPPPQPTTVVVDGTSFTPVTARKDNDCAGQAYGDVKAWLIANECRDVQRAQYETAINGKKVTVVVSALDVVDGPSAQAFHGVIMAPGSGGINGLDGKPLERAAFTSSIKGTRVYIAQAVWSGGAGDPTLDAVAKQALRLPAQ